MRLLSRVMASSSGASRPSSRCLQIAYWVNRPRIRSPSPNQFGRRARASVGHVNRGIRCFVSGSAHLKDADGLYDRGSTASELTQQWLDLQLRTSSHSDVLRHHAVGRTGFEPRQHGRIALSSISRSTGIQAKQRPTSPAPCHSATSRLRTSCALLRSRQVHLETYVISSEAGVDRAAAGFARAVAQANNGYGVHFTGLEQQS